MDKILLALEEHKSLLNSLGCEIDVPVEEIPDYESVYIYYRNKLVGNLSVEERNMFYLYRDNCFVGNKDLSTINFSKRKQKNMRTLIHTKIFQKDLKINSFNMLHSDDRDFICISDEKNIKIYKYLGNDQIKVISLLSDASDDTILDRLRNPKSKSLLYKIGDVIDYEHKD